MVVTIGIYALAALFNLRIPDTGARYPGRTSNPFTLLRIFWHCNLTLWRDPLGQIALAVTTLFWGAGASLQFLVLKWAEHQLDMRLDQATRLQGVVALGVALGAVLAASWVPLRRSLRVLQQRVHGHHEEAGQDADDQQHEHGHGLVVDDGHQHDGKAHGHAQR